MSLRARAVLGGALWILFALTVSGWLLLTAFDGIAERAFRRNLSAQLDQLESLILTGALERDATQTRLANPRYLQMGSGYYWQVEMPDGRVVRSPSMGGEVLPHRDLMLGEESYQARAPEGFLILVLVRAVTPQTGGAVFRVYAAEAVVRLTRDKLEFRKSLFSALIGLGGALALAAAAMTGMALRPLVGLRAAFGDYREGITDRIEGKYPSDIEPLVEDLNDLLERNAKIIGAARRQAADLAHALKTPAAIIRNEIDASGRPQPEIRDALNRIDALMVRYTARARLAGANAPGASAEVGPLLGGLTRVMERVHADKFIDLDLDVPSGLRARAEGEDLEELAGNLIDNAFKWAKGAVRVTATRIGGRVDGAVEIVVEDDGPGIPAEHRATALREGGRLDEAVPGTGLGLAICSDIVEAYDGTLSLEDSELGGLLARVRLPIARADDKDKADA